jgi:hypothetical protein
MIKVLTKEHLRKRFDELIDGIDDIKPTNFWFWVSGECLNKNEERLDLLAGKSLEGRSGWTCDENTKIGDLAVLYRTLPKSDVKYIIQIRSNPKIEENDAESGMLHCDCYIIYQFNNTLKSTKMKSNSILKNSKPVRRNFQGQNGIHDLTSEEWIEINELLTDENPDYSVLLDYLYNRMPSLSQYFRLNK